ncbi:MAG: leucyl/phenylalanyl-tRNA--protein transferase [Bacteroidetes bacterium]|nr:leucyl/phenylalanyl-tRNA--protein transferase [Bacteroidota bacterium]
MSLHILDHQLWFPEPSEALPDGLLAVGGDLSVERLMLAYQSGIFPWFNEDEPPLWWCPNPRFVLFPEELHISKSMKQLLKCPPFTFRVNYAFSKVIQQCALIKRKEQNGTWIIPEILHAYQQLHGLGIAHSAECWQNEELVGGLYGIRLGKVFFGESMFSLQSNASKFAFIKYVQQLKNEGIKMIDCQVHTPHLESLGARMISRDAFLQKLKAEAY